MVKYGICLGGASNQNALVSKKCAPQNAPMPSLSGIGPDEYNSFQCLVYIFSSFLAMLYFLWNRHELNNNIQKRNSTGGVKKVALKFFLCWSVSFYKVAERDSNTGVSCEYCRILKNAYFEEHMVEWLHFWNLLPSSGVTLDTLGNSGRSVTAI